MEGKLIPISLSEWLSVLKGVGIGVILYIIYLSSTKGYELWKGIKRK